MIGPALYRATQQTAVKEVTRPLPSLAELVWPRETSLNTGRLVMHSLYLSHLVEIADGSRHALAINSRICAAFCVLPVYNQLLALE